MLAAHARIASRHVLGARPALLGARQASGIVRLGTDDPRMSKIVVHSGLVYTSGQTAADSGDTVEVQTAAVLDKVDALLKEAGTDKSRALNATIWLKDIAADFKGMNGVSLGCARVLSAGI